MIQETTPSAPAEPDDEYLLLARYGAVPQVARFSVSQELMAQLTAGTDDLHGSQVVVESERGTEVASVLEAIHPGVNPTPKASTGRVLRIASPQDLTSAADNRREAELSFLDWLEQIEEWQLQLQLIDMETTLDGQRILYVLNGQDAETTRLALLVAANGRGVVQVQPVSHEGVEVKAGGGGCGSGCGSGGCSTH